MKKILLTATLVLATTLSGCGKQGLAENTVYSSSVVTNTIGDISSDSEDESSKDINITSIISKLEDVDNNDLSLSDLKVIINDVVDIALIEEKFQTKENVTEEEFNEYVAEIKPLISNVLNKSLEASDIDVRESENFISFMSAIIEASVRQEILNDTDGLLSKTSDSDDTFEPDKTEYTIDLLYDSALSNNKDLVLKILLSDTVDINERTSEDDHVLSAPLIFDNLEMVTILLSAGADVCAPDSDGISIYEKAMKSDSKSIRLLFEQCKDMKK